MEENERKRSEPLESGRNEHRDFPVVLMSTRIINVMNAYINASKM